MSHKLHLFNLGLDDARLIEQTCMEFNKTRPRLGAAVFVRSYIDLDLHAPERADCDKRGTLLSFIEDEWQKLVEEERDVLAYEASHLSSLVDVIDPNFYQNHKLYSHPSSLISHRYSRDIAPMLRTALNIQFPMVATPTHKGERYESELLLEGNNKNSVKGFYFNFSGGTLDKYIGKSYLPLRRIVGQLKFTDLFYLPEGVNVKEANWASSVPFTGIDLDTFCHWTTAAKGNHLLQVRLGGVSTIKGEYGKRHLTAHVRYLIDDYKFYEHVFETNIIDEKESYHWLTTTHCLFGEDHAAKREANLFRVE